jgi:transcriptional/translational regulatory protein YebC/TACO1
VTFNFEKSGYIEYPLEVATADAMFETALEAGANDVETTEDKHLITCIPEDLAAVREALEAKLGTPNAARFDWKPLVETDITDLETAQKLMKFIDILNEDDDVQRVITNANISDEILAQLEG